MPTPKLPPFKTGGTYVLTCTHKIDGVAQDLTGKTLAAQMRDRNGGLVADLTLTADADQAVNTGRFTVTATDPDTSGWRAGTDDRPEMHRVDIRITDDGVTTHSETFLQPVVEGITR